MTAAPQPGITVRATVDRIIDGDTVDVHVVWPMRIRLKDCWAPEVHGEEKAAGEASKQALAAIVPPGTRVTVAVDTAQAHALGDVLTFGRIVGDVWKGDTNVADIMVGSGHATATKVKP